MRGSYFKSLAIGVSCIARLAVPVMCRYVVVKVMHVADPMAPHPSNSALNCIKFSGMFGMHPLATVVGAFFLFFGAHSCERVSRNNGV